MCLKSKYVLQLCAALNRQCIHQIKVYILQMFKSYFFLSDQSVVITYLGISQKISTINFCFIYFSLYNYIQTDLFLFSCYHVRLSCNTMDCSPAGSFCPQDFPGKNTRAGCHFPIQGIFPTQGSNPHILHWQASSGPLSHQGSPHRPRLGDDIFSW